MHRLLDRFFVVESVAHRLMVRYSVMLLRIAIGATFFAFGFLKYFPGVSPAQSLVEADTHILFLGLLSGREAMILVATMECTIGILMMSGHRRALRLASHLLIGEFIGILSPLVLLTGRMFAGPHGAPTLEGQYVLKDFTLLASAMVVIAASFRGGRLVYDEVDPSRTQVDCTPDAVEAKRALITLLVAGDERSISDVCAEQNISEATYHQWRDRAIQGATDALDSPSGTTHSIAVPA